jgi:hypothetical protein
MCITIVAMTAIAYIYTQEGFVIGADGRQLAVEMGTPCLESDSVTKISFFYAGNVHGAYAWTGPTRFQWGASVFDLKEASLNVAFDLKEMAFDSLEDFTTQFGLSVHEEFKLWLNSTGAGFGDLSNPEMAKAILVGYESGKPAVTAVYFPIENGEWINPSLGKVPELNHALTVLTGHEAAFKEMAANGQIRDCSTLSEGKNLIFDYISACASVPFMGHNTIGGHIHIAAITPADSGWMILPPFGE